MKWERGQLLKKDTNRRCPLKYEGSPVSWFEIADWISDEEGCPVHWQTVRNAFQTTLREIRDKLAEFPEIRDWLIENGLEQDRGSVPGSKGDT